MAEASTLSLKGIQNLIPHRYPFLLLDGVTAFSEKGCEAFKLISASDPILQGHFPGDPIWPGVLMVEGLAQAGCLFYSHTRGLPDDKLIVFAGIDKVRFRRMVLPGDRLDYAVELTHERGSIFKFVGDATVNGEPACHAEMMASLVDRSSLENAE